VVYQFSSTSLATTVENQTRRDLKITYILPTLYHLAYNLLSA